MKVLWHKVWFDLWHHKGRTLLAIFSVAAGVFSIGTIFGMVDQLLTGMDAAHQAVRPAHINIIMRDFVTQSDVDDLKELDGVEDVEPVNQLTVRYKLAPDAEWEPGILVMRDDYEVQIYDEILLKDGNWPAGENLGVERLTGQYFDITPGSNVILKQDDSEKTFRIDGTIRHPFVQPPLFGGQAHFFTDSKGMESFGIPEGFYGQLLVRVTPYSLEKAQAIAGDIRSTLGERNLRVAVTIYQDPQKHWGRMFVEGINLVLQIMAVVSLFLSVILIMNTMTALITQQTDQIGVIKSVGGRTGHLIQVYLSGVAAYGLLALIISLPLSLVFAFQTSRWFLNLFNIDYNTFQYSQTAVLLQVIAAIAAPLLAALIPVFKGALISVREAIATYGIGVDFGTSWVDRMVEKIGSRFLSPLYSASLGNMFRRKTRLFLTVSVLVIAGTMFMIIMSLISSTNLTLDNDLARRNYDIRIGFTTNQNIDEVRDIALSEPGVTRALPWFSRNASLLRAGERLQDSAGLGAQLIGIPTTDKTLTPIITRGRWLQEDETAKVLVLSAETAEKNEILVGDTISLDLGGIESEDWEVVGLYRVVYGSGFVIEPIYAPLEAVQKAAGAVDELTQIVLQTDKTTLPEMTALTEALKTRFEDKNLSIDLYTTFITLEERDYAANQFNSIISVLLSLAGLMAAVGGIGLMGALGISVLERRREIGVLRAIGAKRKSINTILMMESLFQGLFSWLLVVPLSFFLGQPVARLLGQTMIQVDLDYAYNTPALFIWLGALVIVCVLASILPARDALKLSVRECLTYA